MTPIYLRKGLDIVLQGKAEKILSKCAAPLSYALKPSDFKGITPKLFVQEGDAVKAGSPVFCDKSRPEIVFSSPVSGVVAEIVRGERRKILEVRITADEQNEFVKFPISPIGEIKREEIVATMLQSGAWAFLVQRPYGIIAAPTAIPKSIFISGFDTAPLAADADFLVNGEAENFQAGVDILRKLTPGKVHLSLCADYPANKAFENAKGVEITRFKGRHPAGNPGVQIHHIDPIAKGDIVWTINPQHLLALGKLFTEGVYNVSKIVALVGSEVKKPRYYRMISGASLSEIEPLINTEPQPRIISGNVLTGITVGQKGYLSFYDNEITVIPEGNHYEALGWVMPRFHKFSLSRAYFSWLTPGKTYNADTNLNGGRRAFVVNGEYEKVLPMDILPVYLLKAILANDIDKMEQLGIYEVIEEDLALCEFVCTSKIEVQEILRKGINAVIAEMS